LGRLQRGVGLVQVLKRDGRAVVRIDAVSHFGWSFFTSVTSGVFLSPGAFCSVGKKQLPGQNRRPTRLSNYCFYTLTFGLPSFRPGRLCRVSRINRQLLPRDLH
jgi:hypothetical protein